jgi:hypothetical protein
LPCLALSHKRNHNNIADQLAGHRQWQSRIDHQQARLMGNRQAKLMGNQQAKLMGHQQGRA